MANFKFGDMICYKGSIPLGHDEPIMYLGPCNHERLPGDIDILSIPQGAITHTDPAMWQKCRHLVDADGYLPGENPKDHGITDSFRREDSEMGVTVYVNGKPVSASSVKISAARTIGGNTYQTLDINNDDGSFGSGDVLISWDSVET